MQMCICRRMPLRPLHPRFAQMPAPRAAGERSRRSAAQRQQQRRRQSPARDPCTSSARRLAARVVRAGALLRSLRQRPQSSARWANLSGTRFLKYNSVITRSHGCHMVARAHTEGMLKGEVWPFCRASGGNCQQGSLRRP